jgi:hypothetical protein
LQETEAGDLKEIYGNEIEIVRVGTAFSASGPSQPLAPTLPPIDVGRIPVGWHRTAAVVPLKNLANSEEAIVIGPDTMGFLKGMI